MQPERPGYIMETAKPSPLTSRDTYSTSSFHWLGRRAGITQSPVKQKLHSLPDINEYDASFSHAVCFLDLSPYTKTRSFLWFPPFFTLPTNV